MGGKKWTGKNGDGWGSVEVEGVTKEAEKWDASLKGRRGWEGVGGQGVGGVNEEEEVGNAMKAEITSFVGKLEWAGTHKKQVESVRAEGLGEAKELEDDSDNKARNTV